ncbi:MAG: hypothetical protein ACFB21_09335 [Opitutales bacterium]
MKRIHLSEAQISAAREWSAEVSTLGLFQAGAIKFAVVGRDGQALWCFESASLGAFLHGFGEQIIDVCLVRLDLRRDGENEVKQELRLGLVNGDVVSLTERDELYHASLVCRPMLAPDDALTVTEMWGWTRPAFFDKMIFSSLLILLLEDSLEDAELHEFILTVWRSFIRKVASLPAALAVGHVLFFPTGRLDLTAWRLIDGRIMFDLP